MVEDNPSWKQSLRWLKPSRSAHLPEERDRRVASDSFFLPPSRNGSRSRFSGSISKFIGQVITRSASSAQQSPNPEPEAAGSSAHNIQSVQSTKDDPSRFTASTPQPNIEQSSNPGIAKAERPDQMFVNDRITDATKGLTGIGHAPIVLQNTSSAADNLQSVLDTVETFSALLGPLKLFNDIANRIANTHPYAKAALSIFTCASKMILDQANRDDDVRGLLSKISEVYAFITKEEELSKIQSMLEIYGKIAQQTLECADFIVHYSEMKSFWRRLGKHVFSETEAAIQCYNKVLDNLMNQFRGQMTLDTFLTVHRIAEDLDFSGMKCADGTAQNPYKNCLPGTREDLLSDIKSWICSTEENVPRVLWLSGTAGKGKSAIAHTIANWSNEQAGLGACFCFDHSRGADRLHERIFTTIARDLADCNPTMRRALARAVHHDNKLKHTIAISRQWLDLVVGPASEASKAIAAPVLIIIDALDESGDPKSREQILRLLAGDPDTSSARLSQLPANFRIIVTSRPLEDIGDALRTASHVRHISMDEISVESTERDIQSYISTLLTGPRLTFDDGHFKTLAQKSDGLFEWARLVCDYIKGTNKFGPNPTDRFDAVVAGTSEKGTRLLDKMYTTILAEILPEDERGERIPMFRSVMGQILASLEPLPMPALTAMRMHFPDGRGRYNVEDAIRSLGSLVTGITDRQTVIRPLHASFYDFLTDKSRSRDFFVDTSAVQSDLAFASLRVMDSERGLRFNICSLENSYLPNSSVPDLEKRVKETISAELSYSCRFWGTHVAATSFESSLAKEVEAFFDGERLLWWLEALVLMKSLGSSVDSLLSIAGWVTGHVDFMHVSDATRDTLRFVRTFAPTILRCTPHLYLSALPFAPTQSRIFRKFAAKFPSTAHIVAGHVVNWPQMEKILNANAGVWSVAISPDAKAIACGLDDGTIQVWDIETGEALCAPLQGHTGFVMSVAFSQDGRHIVSGSWDKTVRVWNVVTGKALGSPLQGHTSYVMSVAISSNGNHVVSGSLDQTIRVWDMKTGMAIGSPLQGHSSVRSVAISPNGNRIVSGSNDTTVRVWDMETGKALGVPLRGHTGCVQSVAISPDGKHVVSGSDDKTIRVWDMETGEPLGAPLQGHTGWVGSVAISSDGNRIMSGSSDQTIRVWDMKTGEALGSPLQGHSSWVGSLVVSPDGNRIISGSRDKTIRVWDADTSMGKASVAALQSHTDSINSVAISPGGRHIVSGSHDKTVRVWEMGTGRALFAPLQEPAGSVWSVSMSPDGKCIACGLEDGTIRVWDMGTEVLSAPLQGHTSHVNSTAISPDGHCIVSGSGDNTVQVWHIKTGEASGDPLEGHSDWVRSVAISSDGHHIVSGSDDQTIQVWDMETGEASSACLRGHTDHVLSVAISLDRRHIVSGSRDTTIRVWDMGTGELLGDALRGHTDSVNTIAISSDCSHIVSGSSDQTIRVWDMQTGKAVGAPFRGHTGPVNSVSLSPDSKHIVSGSSDKTIRVWDFFHRHQLSEICFSSNPTHALRYASSFLRHSKTLAPSGPTKEGWVVGPEGRLLLWISPIFHPVMYAQGNVLVIPNNALQLDLSRVAHGTSWHECRKQEAVPASR